MTRLILGIIAVLLLPGAAAGIAGACGQLWQQPGIALPLLGGFAAGIPLYLLLIRNIAWLNTFEHESTHALAAILFFRRVHAFKVTMRRGGYITHSGTFGGKTGDLVIMLAPYFLPTSTLLLAVGRPFLGAPLWWYDALLGGTAAYHLLSNADELLRNWGGTPRVQAAPGSSVASDISRAGYIFSVLFIGGMGVFFWGVTLALTAGGGTGLLAFLHSVWSAAGDTLYAWGTRLLQLIPR